MPARAIPPRSKLAPHAAWHYMQPGWRRPIEGNDYQSLIDAIIHFRVQNEIDVGEPEADVASYYRNKFPDFKRTAPQQTKEIHQQSQGRNLMDQVRLWVKLVANDKAKLALKQINLKLVDKEIAQERAKTCEGCEANRAVDEVSLCTPCIDALNRNVTILTNNKSAGANLGVCRALKHDNRAACWLPEENLKRSEANIDDETPVNCWLRK